MTLKRPELSESEAAKRARADRIRVGIEECRTRLESIELLLTDSPADALELAGACPVICTGYLSRYAVNRRRGTPPRMTRR